MSAYLLTWNPDRWTWDDLSEWVEDVLAGGEVNFRWSTGSTKSIPLGARVFLLRQGVEPLGIMASGWVTEASFPDEHWDEARALVGDKANYIRFTPDTLLNPEEEEPLDLRDLPSPGRFDVYFRSRSSGISIVPEHQTVIEERWGRHIGSERPQPDQDPTLARLEGQARVRMVIHRARESALRAAKIRAAVASTGHLRCEVPGCGFDFEEAYGQLGRGYAQVHHLIPLTEGTRETRLEDLAVVCANCHAMIHKGGKSRQLKGLRVGGS
jgi:5-methylcytosine-specific restriction endonuclease McrA